MDEKSIRLEPAPIKSGPMVHYGLPLVLLAGLLIVFALIVNQQIRGRGIGWFASKPISADTLAEEYGVQVNLIAVTAAGGLVDLRMQILDAEKAKRLFQDSGDVPALRIAGSKQDLTGPEDNDKQLLNVLEDGNNVFLMFPNAAHVVKPGTPVTVVFGDVVLEPIAAQ